MDEIGVIQLLAAARPAGAGGDGFQQAWKNAFEGRSSRPSRWTHLVMDNRVLPDEVREKYEKKGIAIV